ncbi:hypothetical protein GOBAR_DD00174 [Gossypium barbadense]|nr:hypothetical protein GOBAR_DD00174 [Gossypium barbadense]
MKRKISAKVTIRCGRVMSRLFYKFPVSTDSFKFCEMQLVDDDDLGTMMEIWWSTGSENPQPVELFAELADLKPIKNVSPRKADVGEITNNGEDSDKDVKDFSDLDVDKAPDDIDDEGPEEVEDVHGPSFNAAHASKFLKYADIVPAHILVSNSQFKELFVRQRFENKADYVFSIKQYNMKLSIDYKVAKSTSTLYFGECWRVTMGVVGRHKLARLETDMVGSKPSLRKWLGSMKPWQWAQCFDSGCRYGHMTTNLVGAVNSILRQYIGHLPRILPWSYGVDLRNRRC